MKKAFTLVEMIIILAMVPVFMLIMSRLFYTLMRETPRLWDNVQQNTTTLDMLSQLQIDIDNAQNLPQSSGGFSSNENLLLIEQDDTLIGYELEDGKATRRILSGPQSNTEQERIWEIPSVKIKWNVHSKDNNGYCLELTNYIEKSEEGKITKKMENSHLYFIGAM